MEAVAVLQVAIPSRNTSMPRTSMPRAGAVLRDVSRAQALCSACNVRDKCLSADLDTDTTRQVEDLVTTRIRLRKGETLYRAGGSFTALYAIRSGSLKTVVRPLPSLATRSRFEPSSKKRPPLFCQPNANEL